MYYKIYETFEQGLKKQFTTCQITGGTTKSTVTKPALFLMVLPRGIKKHHGIQECELRIQIQCVSGQSFHDDLLLADQVTKLMYEVKHGDRTLSPQEITMIYKDDEVLTIIGNYTFTEPLELGDSETYMETLKLRQ